MTSLVKQLLHSRESASPVEALKTYLNSWSADDERAREFFIRLKFPECSVPADGVSVRWNR